MNGSVAMQINNQISMKEPGNVFSWKDFPIQNIQSKTVEQNLIRLKKKNIIESVSNFRGLYYKPKEVPFIGNVPPTENEIITAYEKKLATHFYVSGANAANVLGLSTQIPAKSIYYSNRQLKPLLIGKNEITFKRKKLNYFHEQSISILILLAIEYLGKNEVNNSITKDRIKKIFIEKCDMNEIRNQLKNFPKWMFKYIEDNID